MTTRGFRRGAMFAVALLAATAAYPCADSGYESSWTAEGSTAILSPGNDTRSNLMLLLADRYGTKVADAATMNTGIVPVEMPFAIMAGRLTPPTPADQTNSDDGNGFDDSICHSNASGAAQFGAALAAARAVAEAERNALIAARAQVVKDCKAWSATPRPSAGSIASPAGQAFAAYLDATMQFYAGDNDLAAASFAALTKAPDPWLRETAKYMVARAALQRAQQASFDEYGSLKTPGSRDPAKIAAAGQALADYLAAFPQGRYAASAEGLKRRVAWLGAGNSGLASLLARQLAARSRGADGNPNLPLIYEIDNTLITTDLRDTSDDPLLLAVVDLMKMRGTGVDGRFSFNGVRLDRAALERQRAKFAREPALFDYLLAEEAMSVRRQPREVLTLIPDAARQSRFSYLEFSRQMLRGFALEAVQDRNARGFWLSLLPGATQPYQRETVQLAIANHDNRAGQIERVFQAGSPVTHPVMRQLLLEFSAGPALLRQQATNPAAAKPERDAALFTLLVKEIQHGLYRDWLRDMALVPPGKPADLGYYSGANGYDPTYRDTVEPPPLGVFASRGAGELMTCPALVATVTTLAATPRAVRPQLCLAEFFRTRGFDGFAFDKPRPSGLGSRAAPFPGSPTTRMPIYRAVIADRAASADDAAFALNRAIRCYEPSGYSSCGGEDVDKAVRKGWFTRLKSQYPKSSWAQNLRYYW